MGLFKDFSQAVNELVPGGESMDAVQATPVVEEKPATVSESNKLDGLLDQVKEEPLRNERNEVKTE